MQFYFIEKKDEKRFMRFLWLGIKIPSALTDVGMVQFTTTMAFDNLKYLNCCDFFYAEDFVGRIGIMLNITPLRSPDIFL